MDNIISTGLSDTQVYLQNAANLKAPFNLTKQSGQYPAFGDIMVNRRIASMWQLIHLDARIFVDGLGVTSMSAEAEDAAGVRIPFLAPPPRRMRTLGITPCIGGTPSGTPGNSGPFNVNLPNGMQTNAVDIWFNQLYDEAAQISRDLIEDEDLKNSQIAFPDLSQHSGLETFTYLGEDGDSLYNDMWKEVKSN